MLKRGPPMFLAVHPPSTPPVATAPCFTPSVPVRDAAAVRPRTTGPSFTSGGHVVQVPSHPTPSFPFEVVLLSDDATADPLFTARVESTASFEATVQRLRQYLDSTVLLVGYDVATDAAMLCLEPEVDYRAALSLREWGSGYDAAGTQVMPSQCALARTAMGVLLVGTDDTTRHSTPLADFVSADAKTPSSSVSLCVQLAGVYRSTFEVLVRPKMTARLIA
eukprot:PhM_4_TR8322/c1_g1_i1/m.21734